MGCHFPLQGIFLNQELNPDLLHCRWILYWLSHPRDKELDLSPYVGNLIRELRLSVYSAALSNHVRHIAPAQVHYHNSSRKKQGPSAPAQDRVCADWRLLSATCWPWKPTTEPYLVLSLFYMSKALSSPVLAWFVSSSVTLTPRYSGQSAWNSASDSG